MDGGEAKGEWACGGAGNGWVWTALKVKGLGVVLAQERLEGKPNEKIRRPQAMGGGQGSAAHKATKSCSQGERVGSGGQEAQGGPGRRAGSKGHMPCAVCLTATWPYVCSGSERLGTALARFGLSIARKTHTHGFFDGVPHAAGTFFRWPFPC